MIFFSVGPVLQDPMTASIASFFICIVFIYLTHKIIPLSQFGYGLYICFFSTVIGCCFHERSVFESKLQTWLTSSAITFPIYEL